MTPHAEMIVPHRRDAERYVGSGNPLEAIGMDEVIKMYAMDDGNSDLEPAELKGR